MFYEELKDHRESLGITLDQVASKTKINKDFLVAFENGEFSKLPNTYIRLFLKAYAREVGKNPDEVLLAYDTFLGVKTKIPEEHKPVVVVKEPDIAKKKEYRVTDRKGINIAAVTIAVLITFFIIMVLKQILLDKTPESASVPIGSTQLALDAAKIDSVIQPTAETAEPAIAPPVVSSRLTLAMETQDSCWIRLIVDGTDTTQALYPPGVKRSWEASERFDIRLGRPSVILLNLNGKDLGELGAPGIPTRLIVTKDGIIRRQAL